MINGYKYLYCHEDANYRKVINEKNLIEVLEKYGFVTIRASEYSISQQIELFSNARVCVGAHSAGLINCLYSNNDLHLIELHHPDYCRHGSGLTMVQMAYYCNFNYYPIKCESPLRVNDLQGHDKKDLVRTADIVAPLETIQIALESIL